MLLRANKGFTLIELLVVISIIGVIASLILTSVNNARDRARIARLATDYREIKKALILSLFEEDRTTWWTETELGTGNPVLSNLYNRSTGVASTFSDFYQTSPGFNPFSSYEYQYDHDGDSFTGCSYAAGANLLVYGTTLEQRQMIDLYFDGKLSSTCGLITYDTGATGNLIYHMGVSTTDF